MKKIISFLCVVACVVCANAKILRVSNVNGSTAPYSTVKDALEAAEEGDVIMVDASPNSYGDVEINKKVTLQGPGFWLIDNGIVQEGMQTAKFGYITLTAAGAKVSSVNTSSSCRIKCKTDGCVVTRCHIPGVDLGDGIKGAVIHQNYITSGIGGPSYFDVLPSNIQITNNIFREAIGCFRAFCNSTIRYNTFTSKASNIALWCLKNSVFENNIADFTLMNNNGNNTFTNNVSFPEDNYSYYKDVKTDYDFIAKDAEISTEHGAFAGDDPYVISGIAPGPYIEDIEVPVSVVQGTDMEVKVKIGTSR